MTKKTILLLEGESFYESIKHKHNHPNDEVFSHVESILDSSRRTLRDEK